MSFPSLFHFVLSDYFLKRFFSLFFFINVQFSYTLFFFFNAPLVILPCSIGVSFRFPYAEDGEYFAMKIYCIGSFLLGFHCLGIWGHVLIPVKGFHFFTLHRKAIFILFVWFRKLLYVWYGETGIGILGRYMVPCRTSSEIYKPFFPYSCQFISS